MLEELRRPPAHTTESNHFPHQEGLKDSRAREEGLHLHPGPNPEGFLNPVGFRVLAARRLLPLLPLHSRSRRGGPAGR